MAGTCDLEFIRRMDRLARVEFEFQIDPRKSMVRENSKMQDLWSRLVSDNDN